MMSNYEMEGGLHFRLMYNSYSLTVFQYDAIMVSHRIQQCSHKIYYLGRVKRQKYFFFKSGVLKIM